MAPPVDILCRTSLDLYVRVMVMVSVWGLGLALELWGKTEEVTPAPD